MVRIAFIIAYVSLNTD